MLAALLCRITAQAKAKKAYGPALTPAERLRWFRVDTSSPLAREAKRKALERLTREEFGILPREEKQEVEAIVENLVAEKIEALPNIERPALQMNALAERIAKQIAPQLRAELRERDELDEEEEVISLFLLH